VITDAPWIIFEPNAFKSAFAFYNHLGWDWSVIAMLSPISIVTLMEHLGDITTNGAVVGQDFFDDPGVHRTLLGDGLAVCLAGFLGAPPVTTYSENTGVLALTKNYNPKILVIAACYAIVLGILTKFGGILTSVPGPVIGGASMILFGMISSMGLKVLVDNHVDFTQPRNLMIVALILVFGLGFSGGNVNAHIKDISISPLAIATLAGIILNLVLPYPPVSVESQTEESEKKEESSEAVQP
jgi:uracil permease